MVRNRCGLFGGLGCSAGWVAARRKQPQSAARYRQRLARSLERSPILISSRTRHNGPLSKWQRRRPVTRLPCQLRPPEADAEWQPVF